MKIALLTNYPIADNALWKRELAIRLRETGLELVIVYGKSSPADHLKTYFFRRKYKYIAPEKRSNQLIKKESKKSIGAGSIINNYHFFKKHKFKTLVFSNLNSAEAIRQIKALQCQYHLTALDQILSKGFVQTIPNILNIHYGKLPQIKGTSASEWTLLQLGKLYITLHFIDGGVDTGQIIKVYEIPITGDSTLNLTALIQNNIPDIYIDFLTSDKQFEAIEPESGDGRLYTYMHREIRAYLNQKYNIR